MKSFSLVTLLLCVFATFVTAWQKEDHEIFQLRDAVIASEGENTTFYSFVGVKPSATVDQINKAYRKMNARIHPDKARQSFIANYGRPKAGDKKPTGPIVHKKPSRKEVEKFYKLAEERSARLSVVVSVLRGENRDRYDYFLKKGFPKWRGTGYYYTRFRPGLGSVLIGLFVMMGGAAHYGALYLSFKRHREFVQRYISHARHMAWGDNFSGIAGIPGINGNANGNGATSGADSGGPGEDHQVQQWNRKQKRMQEKEARKAGKNPKAAKAAREQGISTPIEAELTSGPIGAKKRVQAENGKVLIVDSVGNVYVEEVNEEGQTVELLLDIDSIEQPTIYDTVLFRLPMFLYAKSVGRFIGSPNQAVLADQEDSSNLQFVGGEIDEDEAINNATSINANAEAKKRKKSHLRTQ